MSRQDVQDFVERVYVGARGVHEVLSEPSVVPGLTWLDAFALIVAADRVAASLERGDYARAAQDSASFVIAFELARRSTAFATVSSAFSIAALVYLPVGLMLDSFAAASRDAAVTAQIDRYLVARSAPFNRSHDFIMNGQSDDYIQFTTSPRGWLAVVDENQTHLVPPLGYTHEQVFGAAKAIYDAREAVSRLPEERRRIEEAFAELLRERAGNGAQTLIGSWAGIYHCSDRGNPIGRIEWTIRENDDGRLIVEENSHRNRRHEREVYEVTLDRERDVYVGRSAHYQLEFRIQRAKHLISLDGTYIGYASCDRFLVSPAAEPPASADKQLAGSWVGKFQCTDRGSAWGEVIWQITYDTANPGTFEIEEERRRDGRSKRNKYRGQFDDIRGYFKASRVAWHVLFRADGAYKTLRGVYWPNTGSVFERCRDFELRRSG